MPLSVSFPSILPGNNTFWRPLEYGETQGALAMKMLVTTIAVALGLMGIQAFAQNSTQEFVTKVAISDMFEIQSSKLAEGKGNQNIRAFARQMVTDHTKTTQELKSLVGKVKVKLPTQMDTEHQQKLAKLQKSGSDFDSTYASMQVTAHERAVKL